jgi:NADPH2:quinone reductase
MSKALRFSRTGGPEVLDWVDVDVKAPGNGEALIRHTAVGLNYIDTYHRSGLYPLPLPSGIGVEGAGVVEAVGPGVNGLKVGDRVAYNGGPLGAYSEQRIYPAERLLKLPKEIGDKTAASMMLKGMTACFLLKRTYKVKPGDTILWHAAAGGVGLIACQWAKALGATVIGTVGSDEKAKLARSAGCKHVINYNKENFVDRVKQLTDGKGVPVVYDSVGKSTWDGSLDCLSPLGLMVSFGNASGAVPPVSIGILAQKGSLFVTRPTLFTYSAQKKDLQALARDLFKVVADKSVKIKVNQTYPLSEARQAHIDL